MDRCLFALITVFFESDRFGGIDFVFFRNIVLLITDLANQPDQDT